MNKTKPILVIGLTGGIGSGKSTVADLFAPLGIDIIDTDIIAHNIITPDSKLLKQIVQQFGTTILNEDQSLNRDQLRNIIFHDTEAKKWLENLLHPIIYQHMHEQIQQSTSPYCIAVIPLLIETHIPYPVDRILVIDSSQQLQKQRTKKRSNLSDEEIQMIIDSQATHEERLKVANDIIENSADLKNLEKQVKKLHQFYLSLL